eukprot:5379604-Prymnesium_polylepis.1
MASSANCISTSRLARAHLRRLSTSCAPNASTAAVSGSLTAAPPTPSRTPGVAPASMGGTA